jgi:GH18 family chitinase
MVKFFRLVVACSLIAGSASAWGRARVVAYVPNWVELTTFAGTIEYAKLTHINIAFENPVNDEGDLSFNKKDPILIEKARAAGVKVLVSIGGGSASGDAKLKARYFKLIAAERRAGFVAKLVDYVVKNNFDGLDVDIEGPSINKDYGGFVTELGKAMHAKEKLLTAALSKGYGGKNVPDSALGAFDFVNIMAYDATGHWDPNRPGQHSSMEHAKESVAYWVGRGLAKDRAVLGVPFYGYGFGEAYRKRDYPYAAIVEKYPGAEKVDQVGSTIFYNGIPTIKAKAKYVVDEGLGGVMIWSLDTDVKGERSLLGAIDEVLATKGE